jgi:hypothetical protein
MLFVLSVAVAIALGQWSDEKQTTCAATTTTTTVTTTTTATTITTTTEAPWILVYMQKNCKMKGVTGKDEGREGDNCYSALSKIESLKRADGTFQLKMKYPQYRKGLREEDGPMVTWKQNNNPATAKDNIVDKVQTCRDHRRTLLDGEKLGWAHPLLHVVCCQQTACVPAYYVLQFPANMPCRVISHFLWN